MQACTIAARAQVPDPPHVHGRRRRDAEIGRRSREIIEGQFPQIVWEHSHVTVDDDGQVRTFCIYTAPDEEVLREHATELGTHTVDEI